MWHTHFKMPGFSTHTGKMVILNQDHVDTDRIIPARFLSRVNKSGYGELLFADVRGEHFPLDQPDSKDATVLIVGTNFGCGSSREHAVWAIQQAGFVCVIGRISDESPGFSDIFRGNAANCGMLLIELKSGDHETLVQAGTGSTITIDLPNQTINIQGQSLHFGMNEATKIALIEGLDLIGTTLVFNDAIDAYEKSSRAFVPPLALNP
jgi:3-isopropylmalate/(R)-2-methylmalate dehydratase small subunit